MSTERATKEIKTTGGHSVIIKTYATGREFQEIQAVYLKDAKLNMVGQDVKVEGFSPMSEYESRKKMLELLVVSLDGDTNNCAERVLDLPYQETEEIVTALNEVSGKKKIE